MHISNIINGGRLGEAAPTLLLIRDKGGAVFGGIAHQPWKKQGTFYGKWQTFTTTHAHILRVVCTISIYLHMHACMHLRYDSNQLITSIMQLRSNAEFSFVYQSAGDYASVIFSLLPTARIYPASGINNHIQWCGVGFSQLPNGLGFGGQVGHFGVWIDETLDTGMSRPAATFAR